MQDVVRVYVQHHVQRGRLHPQAADVVHQGAQEDLRPRQLPDGAGGGGLPRQEPGVDGAEGGGGLRPAAADPLPAGDQPGAPPRVPDGVQGGAQGDLPPQAGPPQDGAQADQAQVVHQAHTPAATAANRMLNTTVLAHWIPLYKHQPCITEQESYFCA